MRLGVNVAVLIAALLIATSALGARSKKNSKNHKDDSDSGRQSIVVAVVNLKVDSDKNNVQGKIEELTEKLRAKVTEQAESFQVVSSKQMRAIRKRHKRLARYGSADVSYVLFSLKSKILPELNRKPP